MKEFFKNKYRVNSIRLGHWDYSCPGLYYVTICTKNMICCLSEIKNDKVYFSEIGKVVFKCWLEIPKHFNNIILDDWIIMPNHLHGIIGIEKDNDFDERRDTPWHVSTKRKFGYMQSKSLSSIINHFKGAVKRQCNKKGLNFQWQSRYYEHIIRNEDDYGRIKEYIANNPINWDKDRNNPTFVPPKRDFG